MATFPLTENLCNETETHLKISQEINKVPCVFFLYFRHLMFIFIFSLDSMLQEGGKVEHVYIRLPAPNLVAKSKAKS